MRPLPPAVFIVPMIVLGIGLLPMAYGFYTLLRLVVFVCGGLIVYRLYKAGKESWAAVFGLVALAYNPLVPAYLSRPVWIPIDLSVIWLFWRAKRDEETNAIPPTGLN